MADLVEYLHKELNIRIEQPRQGDTIENQRCIWHCEDKGLSRRCNRSNKPRFDYAALRKAVEKINRRSDRFRVQGGYPSRDDLSKIVKPMKYIVDAFCCGLHKKNDKDYRAKHLAMHFFMFGKPEVQQESQVKKRKTDEAEEDTVASSSSTSSASILPRPTKRGRQTSKPSDVSSDMATQIMSSSPPSMPSSYGGLKETNTQTTNTTTENNMHLYRDTATNDNLDLQFQDNGANHDQETVYPEAEGILLFCGWCDGDIYTGHTADCEGVMADIIAAVLAGPAPISLCDDCAHHGSNAHIEWSGTCGLCGRVDEMIPIAGVPADHSASAGDNMMQDQ